MSKILRKIADFKQVGIFFEVYVCVRILQRKSVWCLYDETGIKSTLQEMKLKTLVSFFPVFVHQFPLHLCHVYCTYFEKHLTKNIILQIFFHSNMLN